MYEERKKKSLSVSNEQSVSEIHLQVLGANLNVYVYFQESSAKA